MLCHWTGEGLCDDVRKGLREYSNQCARITLQKKRMGKTHPFQGTEYYLKLFGTKKPRIRALPIKNLKHGSLVQPYLTVNDCAVNAACREVNTPMAPVVAPAGTVTCTWVSLMTRIWALSALPTQARSEPVKP